MRKRDAGKVKVDDRLHVPFFNKTGTVRHINTGEHDNEPYATTRVPYPLFQIEWDNEPNPRNVDWVTYRLCQFPEPK